MRKVPLVLISIAAVFSALQSASPASAAAPAAAAMQAGIAWKTCGQHLQCAKVSVPLNWRRPDGTHIKLAVIRRLASDQKHLIGSMFVNPGGPGESGVDLVRNPVSGPELLAWGGGRFNVVGWDPRGTNGSDPVRCFTSQASEARFWRGVQIPTTQAESRAYERRAIELARRCGQVSGQLLDNISTEDTARDLNYLRQLVGDRALTYVGLSYGTMIGQTYANMFPTRVRAMMLDGVVEPEAWVKSAESRIALSVSTADGVFARFVKLCQAAGPARCALARHYPETVAERVAGLFQRARRAPIPARTPARRAQLR
jgi:pimeloyl-ACP methyl ester carboxylesterase